MRIAMWSGPRNLSTAMMYAFGNRTDCAVVDEPFYASYLAKTGLDHPMRDEILDSQPQDPCDVAQYLGTAKPADRPHFYQKHMTQHMIDGVPRDWMRHVTNVFLIPASGAGDRLLCGESARIRRWMISGSASRQSFSIWCNPGARRRL